MTIRTRALGLLACVAAGFALALSNLPVQLPTVCVFKRVTGLPCGSCGMTHAFCALARGHIRQAEDYHIACILLAMVIAGATVFLLAEAMHNRPFLRPAWEKANRPLVWAGIALFLIGWAINLTRVWESRHPVVAPTARIAPAKLP